MLKRVLDVVGAAMALVMLLPVLLACALAVRLSSPGPVLFRQTRIGFKGTTFEMLKFRSMVQDAELSGTGLYSYSGDPRVTRLGNLLRKTSLDEMPQLFNVLVGDMSLVGPRPPVTYELGDWDDYTPEMRRRFDVRPGITGLAQVSGRNELDWDAKVAFDNLYVALYERCGVWVDLAVLLRTVYVVIAGRNTIETPPEGEEGPITQRARKAMETR